MDANARTVASIALGFSVLALIAVITLLLTTPDLSNDLQERVEYLECVHLTYEDGSTVHEDAEAVSRFCPERPTP